MSERDKQEQWVPMELRYLGEVHALLMGGGGKLSIVADDSGDAPRKPKGLG
jgi:hypothetical protein